MLAGVDLNGEEEALHAALSEQPWVVRALVRNDTFALLRSGTDAPAGVAVVCGAGINCVGIAPDGRMARFSALGAIAGDRAAGALIDRLADEVTGFALAALTRLDMLGDDVDVVLGGGLLRAGSAQLDDRIDANIHSAAPQARIVRTTQPPVVGAAVLALDEAGASATARERLREQFANGEVILAPYTATALPDEPMRDLDGRQTSA